MLGIVPAAGEGTRLQPLGCAKELLPLLGGPGRPRALIEFLLERMLAAGAERIAIVISPDKAELARYFKDWEQAERLFFVLQPRPAGLCDALFRATRHLQGEEAVLIGLPDTIWLPHDAFARAPGEGIHLITFPVERPHEFDAVIAGPDGCVARVEVKLAGAAERRVWGALRLAAGSFRRLDGLWRARGRRDRYLGDLLNASIAAGETVTCDARGTHYWDLGTPAGYARAQADGAWQRLA